MAPKRGRRPVRDTVASKRARGEFVEFVGTGAPLEEETDAPLAAPTYTSDMGELVATLRDESLPSKVPAKARAMLAAGVGLAIAGAIGPADQKHESQDVALGYVQELLEDISIGLKERVDNAQRETESITKELQEREKQAAEAAEALNTATSAAQALIDELNKVRARARERQTELKSVAASSKSHMKESERVAKEKLRLEALQTEELKALLEPSAEAEGDVEKVARKLAKELERYAVEPALAAATPAAFAVRPEDRSEFDVVTVDGVKGFIVERLADMQARTETLQTECEDMETEVVVKEALLEQAAAKVGELEVQIEKAEAEREEMLAAKVSAEAQLDEVVRTSARPLRVVREAANRVTAVEQVRNTFEKMIGKLK